MTDSKKRCEFFRTHFGEGEEEGNLLVAEKLTMVTS